MARASFFSNNQGDNTPDDSLLHGDKESEGQEYFFKKTLFIILISFGVMLFLVGVIFFANLRGEEKTVIPNVENMDILDGLISLQERGLYPRVQVKFNDDPQSKGLIISQSLKAGSSVRAGRRVTLTVSKGAVIDHVGDYMGRDLEEVKAHFQSAFATYKPLLQVAEVIYQPSDEPVGTILAQEPAPNQEISDLTDLTFIVSRGMDEGTYKVENFTGKGFEEAIQILSEQKIPFIFSIDESAPAQNEVVVFKQSPAIGEFVELGTPINLTINQMKNIPDGYKFGLFEHQLPVYMIPVTVQIQREVVNADPEVLFTTKYPGGQIAIPYLEKEGTNLVLLVSYKEKLRLEVE